MMRLGAVMRVASQVAGVASDPAPAEQRASEVLRTLADVIPYVGGELSLWDPLCRGHIVLSSDGYPDEILSWLNSQVVLDEIRSLGMLAGTPMRMRDVPARDRAMHVTINEVLVPAGYREGLTMALVTPDGRHTGALHLSVDDADHPTDDARDLLGALNGVLATVCDATRSSRLLAQLLGEGLPAVALSPSGQPIPLPDAATTPVIEDGSPALETVHALLARERGPVRVLWPDPEGDAWYHLTGVSCHEPGVPNVVGVVTAQISNSVYGLTRREIEVLSLLTLGLSNAQIANRFVVSPRTVSTHVEHILDKLGTPTRTAAAALAADEGIVLADVALDAASVRSVD